MMAMSRGNDGKFGFDFGKYVRYTDEQVQALERLYHECPKPNSFRRQNLLRECPILSNIESKQIKVWFQNRRCREKQRKEGTRLLALNEKLAAMNKVLVKQNDNLSKQAIQFLNQNIGLRRQLKQLKEQSVNLDENKDALATAETSSDYRLTRMLSKRPVPQSPLQDLNPAWLLTFAEEILSEFLTKATGTDLDWIQIPGMKPGLDSIGVVAVGHGCDGVAARACSLVGMDSSRVADVLKDRPAWFRDCRRMEMLGALTTSSGATLEFLYTQMYSPTTLTQARDFCTLRYTSVLEDKNLVAGQAPEVLRPMYESSAVMAQKLTIAALRHLRSLAQEAAGEVIAGGTLQPSTLRELSLRIARSFNDAINCFPEDGWLSVASDGMGDVSISLNTSWCPRTVGLKSTPSNKLYSDGGVLCAKASMILQNVPPAILVRFLREHRSEWADWMDCDLDTICSNTWRAHVYGASVLVGAERGRRQIPMPLAHSVEHEEIMELVKFEDCDPGQDGTLVSKETYLLQLCNGVDETAIGDCAQLVFAPVDGALSDDTLLLPSGLRVIPLGTDFGKDGYDMSYNLNLASTFEGDSNMGRAMADTGISSSNFRSIVTIAFQFGYDTHNCDSVSIAARKYMRTVIASVQRVAMAIAPRVGSTLGLRSLSGTTEVLTLVKQIVSSFRIKFGVDLLGEQPPNNDELFKMLWHHSNAIICCTCKSLPEFIFANEAGLDMLETTSGCLQDLQWDQTLDESEKKDAYSDIKKVMLQGFAYLTSGIRLSSMGRPVAYERAIGWNILDGNESMACVAFMFINWSF